MQTATTFEHKLKYENGLCIKVQPVIIEHKDGTQSPALVKIGKRGAVYLILKPKGKQKTTGWYQVKGDECIQYGGSAGVIFWGETSLNQFDNPVAVIKL